MGRKRRTVRSTKKTQKTKKAKKSNQDIVTEENEDAPLFDTKKGQLALLEAFFKHGDQDFPYDSFPDMSEEAVHIAINKKLQQLCNDFQDKPSLVHWLRCGLFGENFVPLALLFIALYEQHPENAECNFKEIYHFLYELTMNRPSSYLSHNSAKVLYDLVTEVLNEVWPKSQKDFLKYFCNMYQYSRPMTRRTYSGKKTLPNRSIT